MKIFSLDAEVDGLYGRCFAIAATVRENNIETASFCGRIADSNVCDLWVIQNVIPALADMPITHTSSDALEESFWEFWISNKDGAQCIAHCGSPVESGLFRRCVERAPTERLRSGPFPLHEVGTLLLVLDEDPTSVDTYVRRHGLDIPFKGESHDPMYDAVAAAVVWEHALTRLSMK